MGADPTLSNADRSDVDRELTDRESAARQTTQRDPQSAGETDPPSGVLRVRCPHCHSPLVLPGGDATSPIDCVACGGRFSLLSGEETLAAGPKAGRRWAISSCWSCWEQGSSAESGKLATAASIAS